MFVPGVGSLTAGTVLSRLLVGVAMWPLLEAATSCDGVAPKRGFVCVLGFVGARVACCDGSLLAPVGWWWARSILFSLLGDEDSSSQFGRRCSSVPPGVA